MARKSHATLDTDSRLEKAHKVATLLGESKLRGARILEVGTGSGAISAELSRLAGREGTVDSVDVVDERVVEEGYSFTRVTNTVLPFADDSFDVVVSNHVIEHVGDAADQRVHLEEIGRVLRPGGLAYVASPSRWTVMEPHFRLPFLSWIPERLRDLYVRLAGRGDGYDCRLLTRPQVQELLQAAGLEGRDASLEALTIYANESTAGILPRLAARLPRRVLRVLERWLPTMIYISRKPANSHARRVR